jgi:hypothetical protein
MPFDYTLDFAHTDFRAHPELYRIGKGEQGVLMVQPYKAEILPHWRFKTVVEAQASAEQIYALFLEYKQAEDFVGMDMARKFLQMGYTRARRYANHPSGRKYRLPASDAQQTDGEPAQREILPQAADWATNEKAEAARVFYGFYQQAKSDPDYLQSAQAHKDRYGK